MQKVAFDTLGCKLNFSETSTIRRDFSNQGYEVTDFNDPADIYVINTCSVTQNANSTCRKSVRRALRQNPDAFVAVVGCYAQLEPEEIAGIEGVDVVLGAKEKFRLLDLFDDFVKQEKTIIFHSDVNEAADFHHAFSSDDRTRAFLKVQDGCSYSCSFCTIPLARGESRSPKIETVIRNAEHLVSEGYKEIVVTGVNAGDFGRGSDESFFQLLRALDSVAGLERIRTSSIEPNLLHEDIIRLAADSEKIQPHFHIPLQSGSDSMLRLMKRRYLSELYRSRVETIRTHLPDASIGVDVITGHPGETDERFQESFDFIDSLPISYLHVFTYSERPDTHALTLTPVIPGPERKERTHRLRRLSAKKRFAFDTRFIGEARPVLFEQENKNGFIQGWTDNYIRVAVPYHERLVNRILPVELGKRSKEGFLFGNIDPALLQEERVITSLIDV
ncbi:MAG: tRNA (N(6)-L-threonylcarbamoyladenosine(37)-C(2))-methylthiotransferase MtaB [Balneolaceae bacterium]